MPSKLVSCEKKPPLEYSYFPNRFMGAIFRCWGYVPAENLAEVLGTSVDNVKKSAEKMGLDPEKRQTPYGVVVAT